MDRWGKLAGGGRLILTTKRSRFCSLKEDLFSEGRQNHFDRVALPESVSAPLNNFTFIYHVYLISLHEVYKIYILSY